MSVIQTLKISHVSSSGSICYCSQVRSFYELSSRSDL